MLAQPFNQPQMPSQDSLKVTIRIDSGNTDRTDDEGQKIYEKSFGQPSRPFEPSERPGNNPGNYPGSQNQGLTQAPSLPGRHSQVPGLGRGQLEDQSQGEQILKREVAGQNLENQSPGLVPGYPSNQPATQPGAQGKGHTQAQGQLGRHPQAPSQSKGHPESHPKGQLEDQPADKTNPVSKKPAGNKPVINKQVKAQEKKKPAGNQAHKDQALGQAHVDHIQNQDGNGDNKQYNNFVQSEVS